jgi:hypothetical protein
MSCFVCSCKIATLDNYTEYYCNEIIIERKLNIKIDIIIIRLNAWFWITVLYGVFQPNLLKQPMIVRFFDQ